MTRENILRTCTICLILAIFIPLVIIYGEHTAYPDNKDIIKNGITGFGAGAVGSQIDNPLAAGAAGAGVNIVGGALLDSLSRPTSAPTPPIEPLEHPYKRSKKKPHKRSKKKPPRLKYHKHYKQYFNQGYAEGYSDGYYAAYTEMNSYTYQKMEER